MNLLKKGHNLLIWILFCFIFSCQAKINTGYYQNTSDDWKVYLSEISNEKNISLENTVLLVLKSSECSPAKTELKRWDNFASESNEVNVKLVILERYERTSKVFIENENISLPFYRDSTALLFKQKLLPTTPMKVYINKEGKVEKIAALNSRGDLESFF